MENGEPFSAEYVETRNAMEPVIELYQHKGASECLPGETVSDELCGFEIIPILEYRHDEPGAHLAARSEGLSSPRIRRRYEARREPRHQSVPVRHHGCHRYAYLCAGLRQGGRVQGSRWRRPTQPVLASPSGLPGCRVPQPGRPHRGVGGGECAGRRSSRRSVARRRSARAARGWSSGCLAAGTTRAICAAPRTLQPKAMPEAFRWAETSPHSRAHRRRCSSCRPNRTRWAFPFNAFRSSKVGSMAPSTRSAFTISLGIPTTVRVST